MLPHAVLTVVIFLLVTSLPPAVALAPAWHGQLTDSRTVQASLRSPAPSPSPAPPIGDAAAEPAFPTPGAAIVNPIPSPAFQPAAPRPRPSAAPTAPPTRPPTPIDNPPTAILNATPVGGGAPLRVTANASFSWDGDATGIVSYQFNWGDGLTTALQPSPTATHLYNVSGSYRLTVILVDSAGLWSSASTTIKVG